MGVKVKVESERNVEVGNLKSFDVYVICKLLVVGGL